MNRRKSGWEWTVSFMDKYGDIHNQEYFETYKDALKYQSEGVDDETLCDSMIELWNMISDISGTAMEDIIIYEIIDAKVDADIPKYIRNQLNQKRDSKMSKYSRKQLIDYLRSVMGYDRSYLTVATPVLFEMATQSDKKWSNLLAIESLDNYFA
tara:strand:+ start:154 stop:615 length:462 start_codon:yes stop_codon:yes gene_type:complete